MARIINNFSKALILILSVIIMGCDCEIDEFSPSVLPDATLNADYDEHIEASLSDCSPIFEDYRFVGGNLPPGMSFNYNGRLSGIPRSAGTFHFTIEVYLCESEDLFGYYDCLSSTKGFQLTVN
ncbi:MAG: putative Ig domain-containing protein [Flavobacteriaceae bacterium]|nr:putative Ig domain-containing protein [Flavobacteriaceae bacterium]